jgi:hypothetical protein
MTKSMISQCLAAVLDRASAVEYSQLRMMRSIRADLRFHAPAACDLREPRLLGRACFPAPLRRLSSGPPAVCPGCAGHGMPMAAGRLREGRTSPRVNPPDGKGQKR